MFNITDNRDLNNWVELNIKDDVGSCKGACPESFILVGRGLASKV